MRVALIDPGAYTPPYDDSLAAALAKRGHDVHLLTAPFRFGEAPEPDGYSREELFFPASSALFRRSPRARARLAVKALEYAPGVARLLHRIRALDPDVVHLQWLVLRPDVDRRWVRRLGARPTVFTAHDLGAMLEGRWEAWQDVLAAVDRVVVHSHRGVDELAAAGIDPARVVRIPHPVFVRGAPATPEPPGGSSLLFVGLIRPYKGLDVLVRALPGIAGHVPDVRLVVAGDPMQPVEPLRRLADEEGVADRIEWRLRFVSDDEVAELAAAAAAVVLPYRRRVDASGVLGTALGHGRPVVVSDVGNLGETVTEYRAGEVVPPGDVEALAAACVRVLSDAEARAAAFRGALAARTELTWDASAALHEQLYEALAHRRVPAA